MLFEYSAVICKQSKYIYHFSSFLNYNLFFQELKSGQMQKQCLKSEHCSSRKKGFNICELKQKELASSISYIEERKKIEKIEHEQSQTKLALEMSTI